MEKAGALPVGRSGSFMLKIPQGRIETRKTESSVVCGYTRTGMVSA